jgi:hypothetical protein
MEHAEREQSRASIYIYIYIGTKYYGNNEKESGEPYLSIKTRSIRQHGEY